MKYLIFILCAFLVFGLDAVPVEIVQKNIPVKVKYEPIIPRIVSREEILVHGRRNLDAKVQLSSDELPQALKHLPIQAEPDIAAEGGEGKLQLLPDEDSDILKTLVQPENQAVVPEKPVEIAPEQVPVNNEIPAVKSLLEPEVDVQAKAVNYPLDNIISESQQIIKDGLKKFKESFTPGKDEFSPSSEQWEVLEKQVNEYFDEEKNKLLLRQTDAVDGGSTVGGSTVGASTVAPVAPAGQGNWFQNIASGVSSIATSFVQNLQNFGGNNNGAVAAGGTQGDTGTAPQQPGNQGLQNFITFINNGFGNLVSSITGNNNQNPTTSTTNLSDSGAGQPNRPTGFFGSVITNVQNALGIQQTGQQGGGAVQGDTGTPQQPNGPGQIIQTVGTAITNFFQGGNRPANTQGDTGTAPTQSNNNIIQNIQNAILNNPFNPFRPQGGQNTQNPIQTAVQSVGTQVQQLTPAGLGNGGAQPATAGNGAAQPASEKPIPVVLPGDIKPVTENEVGKKSLI